MAKVMELLERIAEWWMGPINKLLGFARFIWKSEMGTTPGKVNVISLILVVIAAYILLVPGI